MTTHLPQHHTIDLNCDVGEEAGQDALLVPLVSSVNIACGAHAGSLSCMHDTVALARAHDVAIGAHPGHRDREHFGRRQLSITPCDAATLVSDQVAELAAIAGGALHHVKLHGGLYHQVAADTALAEAVCRSLADQWPGIRLVLPAAAAAISIATAHGLAVSREAFLDRAYRDDATLAPRNTPGSVLSDPAEVAHRGVQLVCERRVRTQSGHLLLIESDTLCLHGDGPHAAHLLRQVRGAFAAAGIRIQRPSVAG